MTISLEQFRAWLAGVEDMQDDGWTPSASQWNKIRSKIDEIGLPLPPHSIPASGQRMRTPLMEPGPSFVPSMTQSVFDSLSAPNTQLPPPMIFEPDVVPPTPESNRGTQTPPKPDANYRSGFV